MFQPSTRVRPERQNTAATGSRKAKSATGLKNSVALAWMRLT